MPWSHTRPETGPGLHDDPAPPKSPLSSGAGRFLMRPDAGAVQKRHPELDPALLGEEQQALPDTQARPAEGGLGRPRPRPQLSRNGPPLGSILMPPDDRRQRAPQILRLRRTLGPTRLNQRLQAQPVRVRQHCPLLIPGRAKRPSSQSVQARTGPNITVAVSFWAGADLRRPSPGDAIDPSSRVQSRSICRANQPRNSYSTQTATVMLGPITRPRGASLPFPTRA